MHTFFKSSMVIPSCWRVSPVLCFVLQLLLQVAIIDRLSAQYSIGAGIHLTPPVYLEYRSNPYVVVTPRPSLAGSISIKKEWVGSPKRTWYWEAGLSTQGLRYYQINYTADKVEIWTDYSNHITGLPSLFFGIGQNFALSNPNHKVLLGLEASLNIAQDIGEISSASYSIYNDPSRHHVVPVFLRLHLGYNHNIQLYRHYSGQFLLYAALSPQPITKGAQYISNLIDGGEVIEGTYHLNNSELGLKFFANLNKKKPEKHIQPPSPKSVIMEHKRAKYRIGLYGQLFRPSPAQYHIPQLDSFSVKSRNFTVNSQIGLMCEFPFRRDNRWGGIVSFGMGRRSAVLVFNATREFSSTGLPVRVETEIPNLGLYGMCNLGISHQSMLGSKTFNQMFSGSIVLPFAKENAYFGVSKNGPDNTLPPYPDPILAGRIDYKFGRNEVLFGMEYNPEIIFKGRKSAFVAVGLVGNYSFGVIAQGRFEVNNLKSTYYGAVIQNFSKLGISMRIGLEK